MENLTIEFGSQEYHGLKFKKCYSEYPYNNKKEGEAFVDTLIRNKDDQSRQIWKNLSRKNYRDSIHIALSYSFVFFILSLILLFVGILISFGDTKFLIKISLGEISLIFMLMNVYFTKRAKKLNKSIEANEIWIDFIFEME